MAVPRAVFEDQLAKAHLAALDAWKSSDGAQQPPSPLLAVRFTPRSNEIEIYANVNTLQPGDGVLFFAAASPIQVYACATFKCLLRSIFSRTYQLAVPHYQIIDSEEDLQLASKSPMRAIGCNIALQNTNIDERRLFAAQVVAPAIYAAFYEK